MKLDRFLRVAAACLAAGSILQALPARAAQQEPAKAAPAAPQAAPQAASTPKGAAPEVQTVKMAWREVVRISDNQTKRTDTVPPHAVGMTEQKGLVFYEGGEVGAVSLWFAWNGDSDESHYRGYGRYDFADGASYYTYFEGTGAMPGRQSGTVKFLGGTGRFEGIQGEGKFAAATMTAVSAGGDTFRDVQASYTVPAKPAKEGSSSKQ
jgi:hypothetical protein